MTALLLRSLPASASMVLVSLPSGRTRVVATEPEVTVAWLNQRLEDLEGIPASAQRLICGTAPLHPDTLLELDSASIVSLRLRLLGGGGDGDQPDWMERGKVREAQRASSTTLRPCQRVTGRPHKHSSGCTALIWMRAAQDPRQARTR